MFTHRLCQWFHRCTVLSKLITLYTLHMYSFLNVNHTSIKWFKKKKVSSSCFAAPAVSWQRQLGLEKPLESQNPILTHWPDHPALGINWPN